jgi:hypothetical protein
MSGIVFRPSFLHFLQNRTLNPGFTENISRNFHQRQKRFQDFTAPLLLPLRHNPRKLNISTRAKFLKYFS